MGSTYALALRYLSAAKAWPDDRRHVYPTESSPDYTAGDGAQVVAIAVIFPVRELRIPCNRGADRQDGSASVEHLGAYHVNNRAKIDCEVGGSNPPAPINGLTRDSQEAA